MVIKEVSTCIKDQEKFYTHGGGRRDVHTGKSCLLASINAISKFVIAIFPPPSSFAFGRFSSRVFELRQRQTHIY